MMLRVIGQELLIYLFKIPIYLLLASTGPPQKLMYGRPAQLKVFVFTLNVHLPGNPLGQFSLKKSCSEKVEKVTLKRRLFYIPTP